PFTSTPRNRITGLGCPQFVPGWSSSPGSNRAVPSARSFPPSCFWPAMARPLATALCAAALAVGLSACGSGSAPTESSEATGGGPGAATGGAAFAPGGPPPPPHRLLARGTKVRDCDVVFDGPGPADWRKRSLSLGPYGLASPDGPDFHIGSFEGGLLTVK